MRTLTAYVEFDAETGMYVGIVPDVPGAHSIGKSIEELRENLKDVLELLKENNALPSVAEIMVFEQ